MPDQRDPASRLELPPREDVERGLELEQADRGELPGLYRMNVVRIPLARLVGFALALVVLALHNLAVLGALDTGVWIAVSLGLIGYCLLSWLLLRLFFVRVRAVHLGTVFVWLDLLAMTAIVYAGGGERSLMWPIYFVRVADQMWISRQRSAMLAVGGVACYTALLLWLGGVEGHALDWGVEGIKLLSLASMSAALAMVAVQPWSVREKTMGARDLILRLEEQSRELDRERLRAEAASRAKSDFLARMSHELRTPLNSVVGFTNVLLRSAVGRDREYLGRIKENGLQLLELVDDILDLARVEERRLNIQLADVDVERLVRETVDQLEGRALDGPLRLAYSAPGGLATVRADEARLRQVLENLIDNAVKFTERGRIDVMVEPDPEGRRAIAVHVRDTGIGIPPERLEQIFQPFEQADGTTSRKYGGAGLGLAVSRSLCGLMGFDLTVKSEPGRGSIFTVAIERDLARASTSPDGRRV